MIQPFQQYAAWRAGCIKADIEMEEYHITKHRYKMPLEEKRAKKKAYAQRFKAEHPDRVKEYSRKSKAKRKAASSATNTRNGQPNLSPTV